MILLYIGAAVVIMLAIVVGVFWFLGSRIPVEHEAASEVFVPTTQERAFELIADVDAYPTWDEMTTKVIPMPDKSGLQVVRMEQGRNIFILTRTRFEPPNVLERSIEDRMFSGTWLYTFAPADGGCRVRLKETGRVHHAVPRAMMKYLFGYHTYVNKHLQSIADKLNSRDKPHKA